MGIVWLGLKFPEGIVEETKKEVKYCAVCECELRINGSRHIEAPWEECIEVCEACFETRPPGYTEVKSNERS